MNCDDFLPALETGDPEQQQEARRHAASCSHCEAAYVTLQKIKATLALYEPLSDSARAVWANASRAPVTQLTPRVKWAPALAGMLTSAACAVVFILVISRRDVKPVPQIVGQSAGPTIVIEHDPTAELAQLAEAVEALDGKLVALAERAERLDIKREIALTLSRYDHW